MPFDPDTFNTIDVSGPFAEKRYLEGLNSRVDAAVTPPRCIVNQAAGFSVTTGGSVKYVSWDTEREDTLNAFDIGSPTLIIIPVAGFYSINLQICWTLNSTGSRYIHLEAGASGQERILIGMSRAALEESTLSTGWTGTLAAGDRIRVGVYQNSGGTINFGGYSRPLVAGGVSANCELGVARIGD